jgi:hypothetical protein
MTAVVTVAPILVNVLRHIAHQFQVWKDLVKLLKRGPRRPLARCVKLPASRILHSANEKVHVDQRLPEGIWIAATEFIDREYAQAASPPRRHSPIAQPRERMADLPGLTPSQYAS